tara:strand:+ start:5227 stop:5874 length:648 start_codon:yes stop_codon:yes gene_type:complete
MTDQNNPSENEQTGAGQSSTGQTKATTLYALLCDRFEPLAKFPGMKFPSWYGLVFVAIIIIIFAWKQIAVGKVESDMAKQLEGERAIITEQAREYADKQYIKEEVRFGQVLAWAVRGELIRKNLEQVSQYLNEIVKMKDTERVVLIGIDGQLLVSTDKRLEDAEGEDLYSEEILNQPDISVKSNVDGKKLLIVPVMGLNTRLATIVVSYSQPNLN